MKGFKAAFLYFVLLNVKMKRALKQIDEIVVWDQCN